MNQNLKDFLFFLESKIGEDFFLHVLGWSEAKLYNLKSRVAARIY